MNAKVKAFIKYMLSALIGAVCTYFGVGCMSAGHVDNVYTPSILNWSK